MSEITRDEALEYIDKVWDKAIKIVWRIRADDILDEGQKALLLIDLTRELYQRLGSGMDQIESEGATKQ